MAIDSGSGLHALQRSIDLDSLWQSSLQVVQGELQHHSCSLMFGIDDFEPGAARHHVGEARRAGYVPATSLSVSRPFLATHPQVQLYTFSQIAAEDPQAHERRLAQEPGSDEWRDFVHLAFWHDSRPQAVLSIRRSERQARFSAAEFAFLEHLYPQIDAGLHRLRALEQERYKTLAYERALNRSALAVILSDARGNVLFGTPDGVRLCQRWMRNAPPPTTRLPRDLLSAMQSCAAAESAQTLRHAVDAALSVTIDRSGSDSELRPQQYYVLSFVADDERPRARERASEVLGKLSPSERKVALLVAEGLRNEQIAQRLSRSRRTVESQLNAIFGKLGFVCRAQLVRALS